jgi:hypothetical protein
MSIATFSALRTEIASWLNRTDLTTAQLSMFVTMAESDFRNDLEVRDSEVIDTGTLVADGFTAPSGWLYTRLLTVDGKVRSYLPPEQYQVKVDNSSTGTWYTISGSEFQIIGGNGSDYIHKYMASITALSADGDSNWLLANAPEVYLWAGCKYGSVFLRDPQGAAGYDALYKEAAIKLTKREREAKYAGPIVVRTG